MLGLGAGFLHWPESRLSDTGPLFRIQNEVVHDSGLDVGYSVIACCFPNTVEIGSSGIIGGDSYC